MSKRTALQSQLLPRYSSLRSVSTRLKPSWLGYESVVRGIAKKQETESKELRNAENPWKIDYCDSLG